MTDLLPHRAPPAAHDLTDSYWQKVRNTIDRKEKLIQFLTAILPPWIPGPRSAHVSRDEFLEDVHEGMKAAPMSVRLTPHVLSVADWNNPYADPIRRQFIPLKSAMRPDHPALSLDSLHETEDSPVPGLVHRYPDKVLFLATTVCPVYCRFCTRSYAVGNNTESVVKVSQKPTRKRWEAMFEYIEKNPSVQDVVVSGGDAYYLQPEQLQLIGERLLAIPHIKRFRFATKGLAVCPMRITDHNDRWSDVFIDMSNKGRNLGKQVAMHTHFNHTNEITWATEQAARHLFERGVIVRNQSVLLRGVNDTVETMSTLIRKLADLNIQPYYVYQSDMVRGVEDLRTPLSTILDLEQQIRGTIAGFMMPAFIVDLPGGGGKRLAHSFEQYDQHSGVSTWKAPGVTGDESFTYHDPKGEGLF
ncbi:l-lysine 2 3-aminomutase like protein [Zymoseptoria brevis]|uniref:L-lysine 2 3-aminomutase like protein n=1 Tax=Zymoseptoria brevis TaxID=1047168 RepID=A0A0F4G785_9PEZI|nr:l-lysine 2 3-aminomutase like protein [Zymoseptoria brevis]